MACWPEREELLSGVGSLFFKRVLQIDHTGENWMSSCQGHEVMIKISQDIFLYFSAAVTRLPFKWHLNGTYFGYMPFLLSSCLNSEPILSTGRPASQDKPVVSATAQDHGPPNSLVRDTLPAAFCVRGAFVSGHKMLPGFADETFTHQDPLLCCVLPNHWKSV